MYDCLQFYSTIPKILKQEVIATVLKERADLKMIHDKKNMVINDELAIGRKFAITSRHEFYPQKMNIHVDLRYWTMHKIKMDKTSK